MHVYIPVVPNPSSPCEGAGPQTRQRQDPTLKVIRLRKIINAQTDCHVASYMTGPSSSSLNEGQDSRKGQAYVILIMCTQDHAWCPHYYYCKLQA